jgi:hypothetical protein
MPDLQPNRLEEEEEEDDEEEEEEDEAREPRLQDKNLLSRLPARVVEGRERGTQVQEEDRAPITE